jgi:hypothetical protein
MLAKRIIICLTLVSLLGAACAPTVTQSREAYVKMHPDLDPKTKAAILNGEATVGMTKEEVKASCGAPTQVTSGPGKTGEYCDLWGYKRYEVLFGKNGKVVEVK